jgi:hypothetical protein
MNKIGNPFKKKRRRPAMRYRLDLRRPCWETFYWLGIQTSKELTPWFTYADIGRATGLTKQNAYHECMVALGKVAFALRGQL